MIKGGFDSLEKNDKLWYINIDTNISPDKSILECIITDVQIERSEQYQINDRWEEDKYEIRNCYKIFISFEGDINYANGSKMLIVDLTNSDIYKYHFANFYVYKEDAIQELINHYNKCIEYEQKCIETSTEKIKRCTEMINYFN